MEITLSNSEVKAIIDDQDYHLVTGQSWYLDVDGYVRCSVKIDGRVRNLKMHRLIADQLGYQIVSFKNGKRHDCRRDNIVRGPLRSNDLPLGVYRSGHKFAAIAWGNGWRTSVGTWDTVEEARKARSREISKRSRL